MRMLLLPICLVGLGLLLLAMETLIPSAGMLGLLSGISPFSAVVLAFYYGGLKVGTTFLLTTGLLLAVAIWKLIQWWPHTAIGKRILIDPDSESLLVEGSRLDELIGRTGTTQGLMMPGGYVTIDGQRYDAVAPTAIDANQSVVVTAIVGGRTLRVRQASEQETRQNGSHEQASPSAESSDDLLDDPFEDALG